MKVLINIGESLLLAFTILLTVFSVTVLNKNFVKYEFKRHDYYNTITNNIKNDINQNDIVVDTNDVTGDINNYIDSYYVDKLYSSKVSNNDEYRDTYNKHIRFIGPYKNMRLYRDIFDVVTLAFIILTGILFLKTKFKHNINIILISTGILGLIGSFIINNINNYDGILYRVINDSYHIYLGVNIIVMLIPLYIKIYRLIVKKKR